MIKTTPDILTEGTPAERFLQTDPLLHDALDNGFYYAVKSYATECVECILLLDMSENDIRRRKHDE